VPGLTFVSFKNDGDLSFTLVVFLKKNNKKASAKPIFRRLKDHQKFVPWIFCKKKF
jgi:hypothetical protein